MPQLTKPQLDALLPKRSPFTATLLSFTQPPNTFLGGWCAFKAKLISPPEVKGDTVEVSGIFDNSVLTRGVTIKAQVAKTTEYQRGRTTTCQIHAMSGIVSDYGDEAYIRLISHLGQIKKNVAEKIFHDLPETEPLKTLATLDSKDIAKTYEIDETSAETLIMNVRAHRAFIRMVQEFCHKRGLGVPKENARQKDVISQMQKTASCALSKTHSIIGHEYLVNTIWKKDHDEELRPNALFKELNEVDEEYDQLIDLLINRPYLLCNGKGTIEVSTVDDMVTNRDDYTFDAFEPDRIRAIVLESLQALSSGSLDFAATQKAADYVTGGDTSQNLAAWYKERLSSQSQGVYAQSDIVMNLVAATLDTQGVLKDMSAERKNLMLASALQSLVSEIGAICAEPGNENDKATGFRLYHKTLYKSQNQIADYLKSISTDFRRDIPLTRGQLGNIDDEQYAAVKALFDHNVSIVTGGPGRGKSFVVGLMTRAWHKFNPKGQKILLSPTNKAKKKLMRELTEVQHLTCKESLKSTICVMTVAKFITQYPSLNADTLVIIDESSMLTTEMLGDVCSILKHNIISRVVFAGDVNQLGPIENGNPFLEMIASNTITTTELTTVHRTDSKLMIDMFDHVVNGDTLGAINTAKRCTNVNVALDNTHQNPHYAEVAVSEYLKWYKTAPSEVCVISPYVNDAKNNTYDRNSATSKNISLAIQDQLMPNVPEDFEPFSMQTFDTENASGAYLTKEGWYLHTTKKVNDKNRVRIGSTIVVNATINTQTEERLTNGDIATVTGMLFIDDAAQLPTDSKLNAYFKSSRQKFTFDGIPLDNCYYVTLEKDGFTHIVSYVDLMSNCDLGYALTTHKAQGSEYKHVIVVLPSTTSELADHPFVNRNLVYTALTRAKETLTVIGSYNAFANALAHPAQPRLDDLQSKLH